jgi:hypothetical protein
MKDLYKFLRDLELEGELKELEIKEVSICEQTRVCHRKKKLRQLNPRDLLAQRASFFRIFTSLSKDERVDLI